MIFNTNQQQGFTLIETLLAVLLLTTAIAGPLTIASRALNAAVVAKDQITAFYLAQDGMEYVRFLRDSACLTAGSQIDAGGCPVSDSNSWLSSLSACISTDGSTSCYLDSFANHPSTPTTCSGTCPVMQYVAANKMFNYNGTSNPSIQQFVRTVSIKYDPATNADEAVVTVRVTWTNLAGVTHAPITIRENLMRWQ